MLKSDLLFFTKQLAVMLRAGIPIESAISDLADSTHNKKLSQLYQKIRASILSGHTFADALSQHPKAFDRLYIALIQIGEQTGKLDIVLSQLVTDLIKIDRLNQKIKSALLYPSTVLAVLLLTTSLISIFILPKFVDFFASFSQELPLSTRILINLSIFSRDYGVITLALIITFCFVVYLLAKLPNIKFLLHRLVFRLPLIGTFLMQSYTANTSRSLSLMLRSGIPITLCLKTLIETSPNAYLAHQLSQLEAGILRGNSLFSTLQKNKFFPPLFIKMVGVGEKTGSLANLLGDTSVFFENEVNTVAKNSTTALEPFLLIIVGLLVGFMALAIISPIYQLTGTIGQ